MENEQEVALEQLLESKSVVNPVLSVENNTLDNILIKGQLATNPDISLFFNIFDMTDRESPEYNEYEIINELRKLRQMKYGLAYKITPNIVERVITYKIKYINQIMEKHPALRAIPNYYFWAEQNEKNESSRGYMRRTLCTIISSVEFPFSDLLALMRLNFTDLKAVLYQICHLEACLEDIQLIHGAPHFMVEEHAAPIDLYYQHKQDGCVLIRTQFVIKLLKFDEAEILGPTDLGGGGVAMKRVSSYSRETKKEQPVKPDNFAFIMSLLEKYREEKEFYRRISIDMENMEIKDLEIKDIDMLYSAMKNKGNLDKLDFLAEDAQISLKQAQASGQPIYCTPKILHLNGASSGTLNTLENTFFLNVGEEANTQTKIKKFFTSNYGRDDFQQFIKLRSLPLDANPFASFVGQIFIKHDIVKLTEIAQVLMENTLKSLLKGMLLCWRHYKDDKKIFFLLLMNGLFGFYQNEMLIDSEVTFELKINWESSPTKRKAVPGFKGKYQWVFFDMVKRTENVVETLRVKILDNYYMKLPYNPDTTNIFEMCYFVNDGKFGMEANQVMEANCVLASMLEGCHFQEVEQVPLNKIFVGLETAEPDKILWKSASSMRNDNFAPEARHRIEGRYATHWTSKIERNNGRVNIFRSIRGMEKCGPRNLNFGEHFEYIAQIMLYTQIHLMTKKLRLAAFSFDKINIIYKAAQLNGILFLLLRATLESKKTPLKDLYEDYVANAKRDAAIFRQKEASAASRSQLFKEYYTGISDELVALALADEKIRV